LSAEFLVRLKPGINRKPFPVMSLAMDTSTLTACGNDYNFNKIFERNLDAFGSSGDILLAISTSGNSTNVINAIKLAKRRKIKTIGFLGFNGGKAKKILDLAITVNNKNVARIQEAHIFLGHFIFEEVESLLIYK
jgi:D-sedoheptulose 7-phosphate isomerase